jgi:hypothetical protein
MQTLEEKRARNRAYNRKRYAANPAKVLASNRKWAVANPENMRANGRRYYAANKEKERDRKHEAYAANPKKYLARAKKWHAANLDRSRAKRRKRQGLPLPTRPMPELCEMNCGRKAVHLDHCHITGVFRGWLCYGCNLGLGALGDTAESLRNGLDYLARVGV